MSQQLVQARPIKPDNKADNLRLCLVISGGDLLRRVAQPRLAHIGPVPDSPKKNPWDPGNRGAPLRVNPIVGGVVVCSQVSKRHLKKSCCQTQSGHDSPSQNSNITTTQTKRQKLNKTKLKHPIQSIPLPLGSGCRGLRIGACASRLGGPAGPQYLPLPLSAAPRATAQQRLPVPVGKWVGARTNTARRRYKRRPGAASDRAVSSLTKSITHSQK